MSREFAKILVSYSLPDGNFLEHEVLQRGLLWGLYRLSESDPLISQDATPHVRKFLYSQDPYHLGLATSYAGCIKDTKALPLIETLTGNRSVISHYARLRVTPVTVGELARDAIAAIR